MKRLISAAVSLLILAFLYWKIDFASLGSVLSNCDLGWTVISLSMVLPLTLLSAWRLGQLAPARTPVPLTESCRLILAASALNMVLPSKMGDIAKAYFMKETALLSGPLSLALVILEKGCDVLALLLWGLIGLLLYPSKSPFLWTMTGVLALAVLGASMALVSVKFVNLSISLLQRVSPRRLASKLDTIRDAWSELSSRLYGNKALLIRVLVASLLLWFLHISQFWLFILALNASVPLIASFALTPLAILAGLMPLTFAGIGTRDAALIMLYQPFLTPATAAAVGVLSTSRYILPALGGLPFLSQYASRLKTGRATTEPAASRAPATTDSTLVS